MILSLTTSTSSDLTSRNLHIGFPNDTETILSFMNLEPKTKAFVCCPTCFQIYPFDPKSPPTYPEQCTYRATQRSPECKRSLRKGDQSEMTQTSSKPKKPARLYHYHELQDWIARLYARPEIEQCLDRKHKVQKSCNDTTWDILDAPELQGFMGPEGDPTHPFLQGPGNEGRLFFSLNMDGFNPLSNKESGKKDSTGAIYMVCLNLPPGIRYNFENMFLVGIIPGPHEPSKEQINHVLLPLVDDLLRIWTHGFFLTSTTKYPQGRLVHGAVVPLICDLPAARQMSGFAGHSSHNFCSFCTLQAEDITNFNYGSWTSRSVGEHRDIATQWRDARSEMKQAELYEEYGIRWSELL